MAHLLLALLATIIPLTLSCHGYVSNSSSLQQAIEIQERDDAKYGTGSLSRKRRFLIFTEGSSVQMVFCLAHPTVIGIGDIFNMGLTAALAWELPQDPYSPFNHHADPQHRSDNIKNIYYTNEKGSVFHVEPMAKRKILINPAFAKRSIPDQISVDKMKNISVKVNRKLMHEIQTKRKYLKSEYMKNSSVEFHRYSRKGLYKKLETFLSAIGHNGRKCVLKTLCLFGQKKHGKQEMFFDELTRAIFTIPQGIEYDEEYHQEYDRAHSAREDCHVLYPECNFSLTEQL